MVPNIGRELDVVRKIRMSTKHTQVAMMEAVEDRQMFATFMVTTTADSGTGSLRDAITKANNASDADVIKFAIGSGLKTISPTSSLPMTKYALTIDGTTQPGYSGKPLIEIRGDKTSGDGIRVGGGNSTIKGLVINRFSGNGMILVNKGGNTVKGNWIGLTNTGDAAAKNGAKGIVVSINNNTIGGTSTNDRNVISGNGSSGVQMWSAASTGNTVLGNYVGTDWTGEKAIANLKSGIANDGAASNTIGGTAAGARNVVSGNAHDGIIVSGTGSKNIKIIGNYVGTNALGTTAIGNKMYGIEISRDNNLVQNNLVSGNTYSGVVLWLSSAYNNKVIGNKLGTDKSGMYAIANQWKGLEVTNGAKDNIIGGTLSGERNVISGNKQNGVNVYQGSNNKFYNNYVGVGSDGIKSLGNGGDGLRLIQTTGVLISGGIIGNNTGYGVHNGTSTNTKLTGGVKVVNDALYNITIT